MKRLNLSGLITATHTPFRADGSLGLEAVEHQAGHLLDTGIAVAFIGGSTGESQSLCVEERRQLTQRWMDVTRGAKLDVIVHVGANCLEDAAALARQAQELGARAIAAFSPSYFKPATIEVLVDCCAQIASAAPDTPFYFYDIPSLTGVRLSMPQFLHQAGERIPSLAGIKYTNPDLVALQECLRVGEDSLDVFWGNDECLLAALALGVKGAVGSTYNYAAPVAHEIVKAFADGELETARVAQFRIVELVRILAGYGYMGASKVVMQLLGVDVGPVRLPLQNLTAEQKTRLRSQLEELGYFDWIAQPQLQPATA